MKLSSCASVPNISSVFTCLCLVVFAVSAASAEVQRPSFPFQDQCPTTIEEIRNLRQCKECFSPSGDGRTKVCCPPNARFVGSKGGCLLTAFHDWCTQPGIIDAKRCFEEVLDLRDTPRHTYYPPVSIKKPRQDQLSAQGFEEPQ